jgi:hypothetical protein
VATYCAAITPPAPARFSTSTGEFQASVMYLAITRVTTSVPPPAVAGMMNRIGCDG